jgi:hypothetical protein
MSSEKPSGFYLGRIFDPAKNEVTEKPLIYDPADLTTHAVITGMTGSGKTGLCISLLEEAALQGIPAIIVDPKGDLTNLVLHFPELRPEDFEPWLDPESARRSGKSLSELAAETAQMWREGLAKWGLGPEQLTALQEAVDYTIYTPGSSAGVPVNILRSFAAPDVPWEENREILREKISSTVTALLGLVGLDNIDPLRSREHILISNIIETAWSQGRSFDLTELILQTQNPPFDRLGAFPLDNFFPPKERAELAMLLNNFLASPSFQTWLEGDPLDVAAFLYTPEGKPRHSIFYLAHLNDNERMFFVTLLFTSIEAWMRNQRGTSGLRAIVYFDEIMGYLPPVANPPSRPVMLRMLKQARAFGIGLLLATQNPVDLDYKGLSNAGTWAIGRLQTQRDKDRLLDGLETITGALDRGQMDRMISSLGKRVFFLHNVHAKGPTLFQTRWALNFLAGPLTRSQIPALNRLAKKHDQGLTSSAVSTPFDQAKMPAATPSATKSEKISGFSSTRSAIPAGVDEFFIPSDLDFQRAVTLAELPSNLEMETQSLLYIPALLAQAEIRYLVRKYNLEFSRKFTALVEREPSGLMDWNKHSWRNLDLNSLHTSPLPQALFAPLPPWLSNTRALKDLEKDFVEWVFRNGTIYLRANEALKVYLPPTTTEEAFRKQCEQAAQAMMATEKTKLEETYQRKIDALRDRIERQKIEVKRKEEEFSQRRLEEIGTGGELLMSLFGGRKRSVSSSLTKRRLTAQAKAALEQEKKELETLEKQLSALEQDYNRALSELQERWTKVIAEETQLPLPPQRSNIFVELFGIAWCPYYLVTVEGKAQKLPAFSTSS